MKLIKKLTTILFAFMMVLSATTMVFAEEGSTGESTKGSIEIDNAIPGHEYKVYKILELESFNTENSAYAYKLASGWEAFIDTTSGAGKDYLTKDTDGYVTWKGTSDEARKKEFAQKALKFARETTTLSPTTHTAPDSTTGTAGTNSGTVKFTINNLDLGYYLVDSGVGSLCSIDTTNKTAHIKEKNGVPTIEKKMENAVTNAYDVAENNTTIGKEVKFRISFSIPKGVQNFALHDSMGDGFTIDKTSTKIVKKDTTDNLIGTKFTKDETPTDNHTFDIKISDESAIDVGDYYLEYTATLNEKVLDSSNKVENKAWITYGVGTDKTNEATTTTKTFSFTGFKYASESGTDKALAKAEFSLSKDVAGTPKIQLIQTNAGSAAENAVYRVAKTGETGAVDKITTPANGKFEIKGLGAGEYYLKEEKAPNGYNKLNSSVKVTITSEGKVQVDGADVTEVKILNKTGTLLPSTGGVGTTMMYIVGAALLIGSGVLLITKKNAK